MEKNLDSMLSIELANSIDNEIITSLVGYSLRVVKFLEKIKEIKSINREGKINSILFDINFVELLIENTDEYKLLTAEEKDKYRKNGSFL